MAVFIAFLRGINVGGRQKLKMADLKSLCEGAGFSDVQTHLQSGNVVLRGSGSASSVAAKLERAISDATSMDVKVVVRTAAELRAAVDALPFLEHAANDPSHTLIGFLSGPLSDAGRKLLERERTDEELVIGPREVYAYFPAGMARSKLASMMASPRIGAACTARNWNTVTALMELVRG